MTLRRTNILCALLAVALLAALLGLATRRALANVTLQSFTAVTTDGDPTVYVEWVTATEVNTAGFFLSRSLTNTASSFVRISPFVPAQGDSVTGSTYDYTDATTELNTTYYYMLEVINNDQSVDLHGPIAVTAGVAVTPDPADTPTRTPTATITLTPTTKPTRTREATPVPTDMPTIDLTRSVLQAGETITPQPTISGASPLLAPAAPGALAATPAAQSPAAQIASDKALAIAKVVPTLGNPQTAIAAVPARVPTNPQLEAIAPVVISTPAPDDPAPAANSPNGPVLLIISAVLLLIGGLYAILRQAGK